ncbi:Formyltransferase/hydrolase complex Fhc subunit C [Stieleria neptunia]|uniref:Formyltransferase/hydrolase complex Fhc subunit C n=1 Tax=Stieleria neptunia TaxID=2527979 RepID=A0A518HPX0_9BACT|nr:hypothetical protein [Stieleria neptunia]QDV42871.1 Formyltransferase/hydrolase complex Fhc subunit C [Stieleria neptunia]
MTRWHLRRRARAADDAAPHSIDASNIRRSSLAGKPVAEIHELAIGVDGQTVRLADWFELTIEESETDQVVVEGPLQNVHGLAAMHDRDEFQIIGHVGDHAACGMTGGTVWIQGDAGDFVAAPHGARRSGMSGGVIKIDGSVGNYAGHRMRRGTLLIRGSTGTMLGASMVAGTICVGGETGEGLAVGMKRGSLILANASAMVRHADQLEDIAKGRFSSPTRFDPAFFNLYSDRQFREITQPLERLPVFRTRADRTVGGLGEVIFASTAELALGE